MPTGRPTDYKPEYAEQAYKLCLLGATDKNMADFFEVSETTVNNWKIDHSKFLESLKAGKENADAVMAHSLYHRGKGYSHPEDKIFNNNGIPLIVPTTKFYPPDTTAAIFWLKNRRPDLWRDLKATEITGKDGGPMQISHDYTKVSDEDARAVVDAARGLDDD